MSLFIQTQTARNNNATRTIVERQRRAHMVPCQASPRVPVKLPRLGEIVAAYRVPAPLYK